MIPSEEKLLRIFFGESDKHKGVPLYEYIVNEARRRNMAGATALRGILGFGADSRIHSAKVLQLSEDLPVVVEIIDTAEHIESFLPFLDEVIQEGLITLETVSVIAYRNSKKEDIT